MTETVSHNGERVFDRRLLLLDLQDNIVVARYNMNAGTVVVIEGGDIHLSDDVSIGFKIARMPIRKNEKILKYGAPIGSATQAIAVGEIVHFHNMKSDYLNSGDDDSSQDTGEAICADG